jgi:hypothetical protein
MLPHLLLPIWLFAAWFLVHPKWELLPNGQYAIRDDKPIKGGWLGVEDFATVQDCEAKRKMLIRPEQRAIAASIEEAAEISINKSRCVSAEEIGAVDEPGGSVAPGAK